MAKRKAFVRFQCQKCKQINYSVHKTKTVTEEKLELNKFCKWCKTHTSHKEMKK